MVYVHVGMDEQRTHFPKYTTYTNSKTSSSYMCCGNLSLWIDAIHLCLIFVIIQHPKRTRQNIILYQTSDPVIILNMKQVSTLILL